MSEQLFTYALVKALYDRNRDYIVTFTPFVLRCLDSVVACEVTELAAEVSASQSMTMPIHVVERILKKAKRDGLVEELLIHKGALGYRLTIGGENARKALKHEEDVRRRVNALLAAICEYARAEQVEGYTVERARSELLALIAGNLELLARYVNPRTPDGSGLGAGGDGIMVLRYIEHAKTAVPEHYATIHDLVFGSVVTAVLKTADATALSEINRPLRGTIAYLDSNVIFGLLGMQSDHLASATREAVSLMKTEGFVLRAFDFSVDEARSVLRRYAKPGSYDILDYHPDSVFVQMRIRGMNASDAIERAANLDTELKGAGVTVERCGFFNLVTYVPRDQALFDSLFRTKMDGRPDADPEGINRTVRVDMAAIETVASRRSSRVAKLADAKYVFITRDRRLASFNRNEMGHQTCGTIPEVLLDSVVTNMLWLKNPKLEVSLESVIATHSDDLLKFDTMWLRFSEIAAKLRAENRIDEADASALLTEEAITAIMEESPSLEPADVDEGMVLEEARRFREKTDRRIKALEQAAEDNKGAAEQARQQQLESERRSDTERADLTATTKAREASIRHLVRDQARRKALNYCASRILPVVLIVYAGAAYLLSRPDVSMWIRGLVGGLMFLVASGAGWLVFQLVYDRKKEEAEFELLRSHGLN